LRAQSQRIAAAGVDLGLPVVYLAADGLRLELPVGSLEVRSTTVPVRPAPPAVNILRAPDGRVTHAGLDSRA
jgi:hypothetical protein